MVLPKINIKVTIDKGDQITITGTEQVVEVLRTIFNQDTIEWTEEMIMICLNRQNDIIGYYKIASGGFSGVVCDPKVVLTIALQCAASGIILAHNHPSGSLTPSVQDKELTRKIADACKLLDMKLLDHIIITKESYYCI